MRIVTPLALAAVLVCVAWVTNRSSSAGQPTVGVVAEAVVGVVFVVAGLISNTSRTTPAPTLLLLTGFTWLIAMQDFSSNGVQVAVAELAFPLPFALMICILVWFPAGRSATSPEKLAVQLAAMWVLSYWVTLLGAEWATAENPLAVVPSDRWEPVGTLLSLGFGFAAFVVLLPTLLRRYSHASRPARAIEGPLLLSGVLLAAGLCASVVRDLVAPESRVQIDAVIVAPMAGALLLAAARFRHRQRPIDLVLAAARADTAALQSALRVAAGDPTLQLLFLDRAGQRYVDSRGLHLDDAEVSNRWVAEIGPAGDETSALLSGDQALAGRPDLAATLREASALALENGRLTAELRARLHELDESRRRILDVQQKARKQLEQDLHDGAQHHLISVLLRLELLRRTLTTPDGHQSALAITDDIDSGIRATVDQLRDLARGVHPHLLTAAGLGAALQSIAEHSARPVQVALETTDRLEPAVESALFLVASEAVTNATKHGGPDVLVRIDLRASASEVELIVSDNGVGGATPRTGTGIASMSDRLGAIGGTLSVESPAEGGTTITASVPCA